MRTPNQPTGNGPFAACAALVVMVVAVVLFALLTAAVASKEPDWGSVPAWLAFLASTGTLVGIWLAYRTLQTNGDHRRDDEASLARLLVIEKLNTKKPHPQNRSSYIEVSVTLRNASSKAFSQIVIEGVTQNGVGCHQTVNDRSREFKDEGFRFLRADATVTTEWVNPRPNQNPDVRSVEIVYRYLDGNGRRWRRLQDLEPVRIYTDDHDDARFQRFEAAMAARPNDGGLILPPALRFEPAKTSE
ncbi:hypothetical protein [Gordonia rubripertincta]|uniref:Uncharacterized protein n=1 Tax=Gordonia rubripertincta TaxID=36822 RepID=A0ABT4MTB1_GORRU|nr:hypothetical protein [Gordonia rubripertincta]MCZ4550243.1 hypothetical protein [Gordonia rubripertincta]